MSGEFHAPAALPPALPLDINKAGWAPEPVWTTWTKFSTLPALELRPLGRAARSHVLYRLSYPGS
jgi:hypothetical protein